MEEIEQKLIQMIRETGELPPELILNTETNLSELGVNSISFIKVVVLIEQAFEIEFDDEDLDYRRFTCVGDLIAAVERKCEKEPLAGERV